MESFIRNYFIRCALYSSLGFAVLTAGCTTAEPSAPVARPEPSALSTETAVENLPGHSASTESAAQSETTEEALWARLAQADEHYVVLLRHAIAPGTGDPANFQLDECSTQRNLSDDGRQQAKDMGEAFRSRNIPVIEVLSSQWCRCLETAELMDVGPVEPFPALNSFFRDRSTAETQTNQVQAYAAANSERPGVTIMVTHQVNITALSSIFPPSGSAVVVQLNDGQLSVVGQLLEPSSS